MSADFRLRSSTSSTDFVDVMELPKLHRASYLNNVDQLNLLLTKPGVNIEKRDRNGRTALHYACFAGSLEIIAILLDRSPELHLRVDRSGRGPAYFAIQNGYLNCLQLLASKNHSFDERDYDGVSPLHFAISEKQQEIAEFLIKHVKVDVNAEDKRKFTPLHIAVENGLPGIARVLIASDANVNAIDNRGRTALIIAAALGADEIVTSLIENGAHILMKDDRGLDAKDWALKKSHERVYSLLTECLKSRKQMGCEEAVTSAQYEMNEYIDNEIDLGSDVTSCSSDDSDVQRAIEELVAKKSDIEKMGYEGEDDCSMSSESFQLPNATPSETMALIDASSAEFAETKQDSTIGEQCIVNRNSQKGKVFDEKDDCASSERVSKVHFADRPEIISEKIESTKYKEKSTSHNGENIPQDKSPPMTEDDNDKVYDNLQHSCQLAGINSDRIPLITMTVYSDPDEGEPSRGQPTIPIISEVYSSDSDEYAMAVERPLCRPSQEFIFNMPDFEGYIEDSCSKENVQCTTEFDIRCTTCSDSEHNDEYVVKSDINIQIITDGNGCVTQKYFEDAEKRYRALTEPNDFLFLAAQESDELNHSLKRTTSNLEIAKAKDEHHRSLTADVNEKFFELSTQRVKELEGELVEMHQESTTKKAELQRIKEMYKSIISVIRNGEDGPERTVILKKENVLRIIGSQENQHLEKGLLSSPNQEICKTNEKCEKRKIELKKKIEKLKSSNEYYKNKVIKLNDERVKQKNEIKSLNEKLRSMRTDMPINGNNEKSKENETADSSSKFRSSMMSCDGISLNKSSILYSREYVRDIQKHEMNTVGRNGLDKVSHMDSSRHGPLAATNDSLVIARQNCNKKIAEELKTKFLEKVEMMEEELSQVRADLRLEKEKSRRLSLHDELKDRFIVYCEHLQSELTSMKGDNKTAENPSEKGLRQEKLEFDDKLKFITEVQEQNKVISLLRDCISETRQKQSKYMKLYADAKHKAEMYDDLVGSNLQLEEALANSYKRVTSLEESLVTMPINDNEKQNIIDRNENMNEIQTSIEGSIENTGVPCHLVSLKEELDIAKANIQELTETVSTLTIENEELTRKMVALKSKDNECSVGDNSCGYVNDMEEISEENRKLVRELWNTRQALDKANNENEILQEEFKALECKFENIKTKAERCSQNDDKMISMEDILEENATLMEANEEITEKYNQLLETVKQMNGMVLNNQSHANEQGNDGQHRNGMSNESEYGMITQNQEIFNPNSKPEKTGCKDEDRKPASSSSRLLVRRSEILSSDIKLCDLIRALNSDTEEEEEIEGRKVELIEQVRRTSVIYSEDHDKGETLFEELRQLTQTNNSLKDKIKYLEKWTDDLNEEVLRLQSELESTGNERDLIEKKLEKSLSNCNNFQDEIKRLKECSDKNDGHQSFLETRTKVHTRACECAELDIMKAKYESLQEKAEEWNITLNEKILHLQEYLKEANDENCTLKHENEQLKLMMINSDCTLQEVEELRGSTDTLLFELETAKKQQMESDQAKKRILSDLETCELAKEKLRVDAERREEKIFQLTNELKNANCELIEAKRQFADFAAQKYERDELKNKLEKTIEVNGKIMSENAELLTENTKLQDIMLELKDEIKASNDKVKDLRLELDYMHRESISIKDRNNDLQKSIDENIAEKANLQLAISRFTKDRADMKIELEALKKSVRTRDQQIIELEKECNTKKEPFEEKVDGNALLEKLEELQKHCILLEAMVEENQVLEAMLIEEKEIMAACMQGARLQRLELERVQNEHIDLKKKYDLLAKERMDLERELKNANATEKQRKLYIIQLENELEYRSKEFEELKNDGEIDTKIPVQDVSEQGIISNKENNGREDYVEICTMIQERFEENGSTFKNLKERVCSETADPGTNDSSNRFSLKKAVNELFNEIERLLAKVDVLENKMSDYVEMVEKVDCLASDRTKLQQRVNKLNLKEKEWLIVKSKLAASEEEAKELKRDRDIWIRKSIENGSLELDEVRYLVKERLADGDDFFMEKLRRRVKDTIGLDAESDNKEGKSTGECSLKEMIHAIFDEAAWLVAKVESHERYTEENKQLKDKLDALESENNRLKQSKNKLTVRERECSMLRKKLSELKNLSDGLHHFPTADSKILDEISLLVDERLSTFEGPVGEKLRQTAADSRVQSKPAVRETISALFDEAERFVAKADTLERKVRDCDEMREKMDCLLKENLKLKQNENKLRVTENECKLLRGKIAELKTRQNPQECDLINNYSVDGKILEEVSLLITERLSMLDYPICERLKPYATCTLAVDDIKSKLQEIIGTILDENERFAGNVEVFEKRLADYNLIRDQLDMVTKQNATLKQCENKLGLKTNECIQLTRKLAGKAKEFEKMKESLERQKVESTKKCGLEMEKILTLVGQRLEDAGSFKNRLPSTAARVTCNSGDPISNKELALKELIDAIFDDNMRLSAKLEIDEKRLKQNEETLEKCDILVKENLHLKQSNNKLKMKEKELNKLKVDKEKLTKTLEAMEKGKMEAENKSRSLENELDEIVSYLNGSISGDNSFTKRALMGLLCSRKMEEDGQKCGSSYERVVNLKEIVDRIFAEGERLVTIVNQIEKGTKYQVVDNAQEHQVGDEIKANEKGCFQKKETVDLEALNERSRILAKHEENLREVISMIKEKIAENEEPISSNLRRFADLKNDNETLKNDNSMKDAIEAIFDEMTRLLAKVKFVEDKYQDFDEVRETLNDLAKENIRLRQKENKLRFKERECFSLKKQLYDINENFEKMKQNENFVRETCKNDLTIVDELSEIRSLVSKRLQENGGNLKDNLQAKDTYDLKNVFNVLFDERIKLFTKVGLIIQRLTGLGEKEEKMKVAAFNNFKLTLNDHEIAGKEQLGSELKLEAIDDLWHIIEEMLENLHRKNTEIEQLRRENQVGAEEPCVDYNKKIDWLHGEKETLSAAVEEQRKRIDLLHIQKAHIGEELLSMQSRLEEINDENYRIKKAYEESIAREVKLKTENRILNEKHEILQNDLANYKEISDKTNRELMSTTQMVNENKFSDQDQQNPLIQIKERHKFEEKYASEKTELEAKNEMLMNNFLARGNIKTSSLPSEAALPNIKIQLKASQKEAENSLVDYLRIKARAEELEIRLVELDNEVCDAYWKLERAEKEKTEIKQENNRFRAEISMIKNQYETSLKDIEKYETNNHRMHSKIICLQSRLEDAVDSNNNMKKKNERMEERLQEALRENESSKKSSSKCACEVNNCKEWNSQVGMYTIERNDFNEKLKENVIRIAALEKDLEEQRRGSSEKEDEISELKSKFSQLKEEKRDLEEQFSLSNIKLQRHQSKDKENENVKESLATQVHHISEELRDLQEEYAKVNHLYSECIRENQILNQSVLSLENKLCACQEQHDCLFAKYRDAKRELKKLEWQQRENSFKMESGKLEKHRDPSLAESIHGSKKTLQNANGRLFTAKKVSKNTVSSKG